MTKKLNNLLKWAVLYYLRFFAKLQLQKIKPTIIGVTGSVGKTSTVNAIEAVLHDRVNRRVTHHANSETGIPLHILGLRMTDYSLISWLKALVLAPIKVLTNWQPISEYVIEMGIDSPHPPKNMEYLLSIVSPHIGVFLNASTTHSQYFDNLFQETDPQKRSILVKKAIATEKGKLITNLQSTGTAILNLDDQNVAEFISKTQAQVITFGFNPNATVSVVDISPTEAGTWIKIKYHDQIVDIVFPKIALTKSFGHTCAAAIAVGISLGMSFALCAENLKNNFILPVGRLSLIPAINNALIIDSSYNASPHPVLEALDILQKIAKGRKLALLGDMRELGLESQGAHEEVAKKAQDIADVVVLVGPQMSQFAKPILGDKAIMCQNAQAAAKYLETILKPSDTLLIKGSQNEIFLEYATEKLMRNPQDADQLLCRRGVFWQQQRIKAGLA